VFYSGGVKTEKDVEVMLQNDIDKCVTDGIL
jgi:hypothetical protein